MHTITLDKRRHEFLLEQKRRDVYTQEPIKVGDSVVACGGMAGRCGSVYLAGSWVAQGYKCLNCNEVGLTLSEIIQPKQIYFKEPVILDFRVNPKIITPGGSVMISWKVDKAETILLNEVVVSGETQINDIPLRPIKYVLKARNSKGWAKERVEEIRFATIRAKLIAEPAVVVPEQTTYLRWEVENATNVTLDNGLGGVHDINSGQLEIFPKKDTHFTLTASNGFEEVQSTVFVRLPEVSVLQFNAERDIVVRGTSIILSWETKNAVRVEISGIGEVMGSSFEYFVTEANDFQVELTAYGIYDEKLSKSTITLKVARIEYFNIEQFEFSGQRQYRLVWQSRYFENLELDQGIGNVVGEFVSIPSSDEEITYVLSGETRFGQKVDYPLTLKPARIHYFEAFPIYAFIGMKGKLQWAASNSQKLEIDKGIGVVTGNEHFVIFGEQHTRFTLTAYGEINVATYTFELKIVRPPSIESIKVPIPIIDMKLTIPKIGLNLGVPESRLSLFRRPTFQLSEGNHRQKLKLPKLKSFVLPITIERHGFNLLGQFVNKKLEIWKLLLQQKKEEIINDVYNGR